ncbi:MAG: hypothetical protein JJE40_07295 [Vicinamibacteria bacterium]|nr:hypothetical protein [Vicinamibacteria bacterium]
MTDAATDAGERPSRLITLLVATGALLALAALAPLIFQRDSVATIDTAIKLIQSSELARTGFQSMALPYPARDLDPAEHFLPLGAPFVFLSAGKWHSIFPSFYAVVAAPLRLYGVEWLVALAVVGAVVAVTATTWLPGAHPVAGALVLLATPMWLYGLNPTETTLALGCVTAALVVATRVQGARGDWIAGLLLGVGTLLRDESLLLAPGLLYARHLTGASVRHLARVVVGVGAPIVLMAVVDQWWFDRPMLAHLRHAVPGFDQLLPRSRARLPALAVMGWHDRLSTIVEYWLLGFGGLAAGAALAAWLGLAHGLRRLTPVLVAALALTAVVLHAVDLASLVPAPRIMPGLLRLSPFLLLAVLPRAGGEPAPALVRLAWVTAGCYLAAVGLTLNTAGGKDVGPRLIIGLWPLLAAAAVETLSSYVIAARRSGTARVTALSGVVLVAGSLVMQLGVVLPARSGRNADDAEAARVLRAIGDQVIVMDGLFDIDVAGGLFFERKLMLGQPSQWPALSQTLSRHQIDRFTYIARLPGATPRFPHYRRAEVWEPGRFVISRWVRETSTSP